MFMSTPCSREAQINLMHIPFTLTFFITDCFIQGEAGSEADENLFLNEVEGVLCEVPTEAKDTIQQTCSMC